MSGPKVVRVRTRAEREAECQRYIDGLRAAVAAHEAFARHHDRLDVPASKRREERVKQMEGQIRTGAFEEVQRACRDEQVTVEFERDQLEKEIVERAASKALRQRRAHSLAGALARRLQEQGRLIPSELQAINTQAAHQLEIEDAERIVNAVVAQQMRDLATDQTQKISDAQRTLAAQLASGAEIESVAQWAANRASVPVSIARLERLIAEATAHEVIPSVLAWLGRARRVIEEPDDALRSSQVDSLLIAWAETRKELNRHRELEVRSRRALTELNRLADQGLAMLAQRLQNPDASIQDREAAVIEAEQLLSARGRAAAATERRRAVLGGLASLGYEMGAELATAVPSEGRIVVRRPDRPGYGVEVMAPQGADRIQVKVIGIGPGDSARDRDAETLWCSEFSRLRELLKTAGTDVEIEKAMPVGSVPLTRISLSESTEDSIEQQKNRQHRVT